MSMQTSPTLRRRYIPAVGPRLKKLLFVVFGLFALLAVNSVYLIGVTITEAITKQTYQNWFYMNMFIVHLALGALIILPVIVFGMAHIRDRVLMNNAYCQSCHADSFEGWAHSVHRFSSFNNPPYLFSVRETRRVAFERDEDVQASRFCAGCHDPVVFFSGKFDDPQFDDVNHPAGQAGITCTVCHALTHINSVKGNSDYTIEEPIPYPFAYSEYPALQWLNRQLIKAKPKLHKKTFLKPLHQTPEFCASCHKVHLPPELNKYKWLRGQNHYDAYQLSGVSGHGITSFYYPPTATHNCQTCHMQLKPSEQFAARDFDGSGTRKIHNHQFPSANTGIPQILGMPDWVKEAHRAFNEGVMRVDIFSLREGEQIDGKQMAPLRPEVPALRHGQFYLLDAVIRTVKMGHLFTQGTVQDKAIEALRRAAWFNPPAPPWSVAWFTGLVNKQNGYLDEAIANFKSIVEGDDAETRRRGFDFSQDYRQLNELGQTIFERAKQEHGESRKAQRDKLLQEASEYFKRALALAPENMTAHYTLSLIYRQLGDQGRATTHLAFYQKYKPDDNAMDLAVASARRQDPAANHAAEAVVIYDLHRPGAYEVTSPQRQAEQYELKPPVVAEQKDR